MNALAKDMNHALFSVSGPLFRSMRGSRLVSLLCFPYRLLDRAPLRVFLRNAGLDSFGEYYVRVGRAGVRSGLAQVHVFLMF
jgi:hypothetical protein